MKYDQYGNLIHPHQGYGADPHQYAAHNASNQGYIAPSNVQAKMHMPNLGELAGPAQAPWVRFPFYPTAPYYSTNPNVASQTRFYGATLLSTDNDYQLGAEAIRTVQFDIPVRIIAMNGSCTDPTTAVTAAAPNTNMLDSFLFRLEYTTGDRLITAARLASTVLGTMQNPGEIGGAAYSVDQGASVQLGLTPLACLGVLPVRIDITLVCMEIRGQRNFVGG
jgi:hypothetical protein